MQKRNIVICISVLFILIIFGGGFLIYKQNNVKAVNDYFDGKEVLSLDDSSFESILDKLNDYIYIDNRKNGYRDFSSIELFTIGVDELNDSLFTPNGNKKINGITKAVYMLDRNIVLDNLKKLFSSNVDYADSEIINSNYLLSNVTFEDGNNMTVYSYDDSSNKYTVYFSKEDEKIDSVQTELDKITDAYRKNGKIYIKKKAIYINSVSLDDSVSYSVYSDPSKSNLIDNLEFDLKGLNKNKINVDSYLDKASTITVVLSGSENGNYIFESSIIE